MRRPSSVDPVTTHGLLEAISVAARNGFSRDLEIRDEKCRHRCLDHLATWVSQGMQLCLTRSTRPCVNGLSAIRRSRSACAGSEHRAGTGRTEVIDESEPTYRTASNGSSIGTRHAGGSPARA